jgi:alpha-2-macroglobulin
VYEEGGDFSVDRFSIPYYPYTTFVGIKAPSGDKARNMLLTDTTHTVNIVTVDAEGRPVNRRGLEIEVFKLNWRWWWDQSEDYISNYVSRNYNRPIIRETINTQNGQGVFKFRVNRPEWGRFFIKACDPASGHCTGQVIYMDWPGWAGRPADQAGGAVMLSVTPDKEKYQVGEDARITIPGSENGRALVSIENGSRVINTFWVETQKGQSNFMFKVTEEMSPNVYVHVSLLQPHSQTFNDLPIRLYGVTSVLVDDPMTHLSPVIAMPDVLEPEKNVTIKVSEAKGRAMAYTLAVVDEGLLDLTRFKTPEPWKQFYKKEALGVKTWDMYDHVIGAFGLKMERLLAIGGDEEGIRQESAKANRFKPVVKYLGPFFLQAGKTNTHSFKMPAYVGSVRTMVVAGYEGAYGNAEKATPVRQPLMVLGTLPRVLGPGETVKLPVNVFAMEENLGQVTVEVKTNDLVALKGDAVNTIHFSKVDEQILDFDLKVKSRTGIGKIQITANGGKKTATYEIEIDVRNPNLPVTEVLETTIEPGKSWQVNVSPVGVAGSNKGVLEVSTIPPVNLGSRMQYLMAYPHGCVEQIVSTVFPQLVLNEFRELDDKEKEKIENHIKAAIDKLKGYQNADGGFAYWPGNSENSDWGTTYAGHFLLEAKSRGYNVPEDMLKKWKKYQKDRSLIWLKNKTVKNDDLMQSYRLYTLALAKAPETSAMNRMREIPQLGIQSQWRLAAAYVLAGQPEAAKSLVQNLSTTIESYQELSYTYGSTERDQAMIVETLTLLGQRTEALELVKSISAALSDQSKWMSTQTTAYCLFAVARFAGNDSRKSKMQVNYQYNNDGVVKTTTEFPVMQRPLKMEGASSGKLNVNNLGEGIVFARLILQGIPETGDQTSSDNNLRMDVTYLAMDGQSLDPAHIRQGTNFIAEVSLYNPGTRGVYKELALSQVFASGWEIHNTRMDVSGKYIAKEKPQYQDFRDDRVYTYLDLKPGQRKTFQVLLNASYVGKYYLPAAYCEAMYDNTINSRRPGMWVEVVKNDLGL